MFTNIFPCDSPISLSHLHKVHPHTLFTDLSRSYQLDSYSVSVLKEVVFPPEVA